MNEDKNLSGVTKNRNQKILVGLGVFFILLILGIILFIPCPTSDQYQVFHVILSLAAAGIGAIMPGFITVKYKSVIQASGALGLFIVVYLVEPEAKKADERCTNTFTVTVFVHGTAGIQERILKNQGKVTLHLHSKMEEVSINENGEATFKEIASNFIGQKVYITIDHPQPYQSTHPDSLYELQPNGAIYLEVALNNIEKIFGRVLDAESNDPLDSVKIIVKDVHAYSNSDGWFELQIPAEWQSKFQRVSFLKNGYIKQDIDSIPVHVKQEIQIALRKR